MAGGGERTPLLSASFGGYGSEASNTSWPPAERGAVRGTIPTITVEGVPAITVDHEPSTPKPEVPPKRHPTTEDDILFKLKFAHLRRGVNWFDKIASVASRQGDDPGAYISVLTTLREYPLTMREKRTLSRRLRQRLNESYNIGSKAKIRALGRKENRKRFFTGKETFGSSLSLFASDIFYLNFWEGHIVKIAAYFGTNVASFFRFMRFLIFFNFFLAATMFTFISFPQIVHGEVYDKSLKTGTFGEVTRTAYFYGAYKNHTLTSRILGSTWSYNVPLAYFLTWAAVSLAGLIVIVLSMIVRYQRIKRTDFAGEDPYASHTLVSWDYSVTDRKGTKIRSRTIATTLKEMLRDDEIKEELHQISKRKLLVIRILGNLFHLAVLGGSGYLIFLVDNSSLKPSPHVPQGLVDFLEEYELSIVVSVMKVLVPRVLTYLMKFEHYSPRATVQLQIARTACYHVASLIGFLASTYSTALDCTSKEERASDSKGYGAGKTDCCWENMVGERVLQLGLLDLGINLGGGLACTGGQAILARVWFAQKIDYPEFQMERHVLDMVYGQCLVWLGLYFMPVLPIVVTFNMTLLFYFQYHLTIACCVPPTKLFRASRSGTFYLFILFVSLFACLLPMFYAVVELEPSATCGPFKQNLRAHDVLTDKIGRTPPFIRQTVHFISTPGFVLPLIIALAFLVLYYRVKCTTHERESKNLRQHLRFTRRVEIKRLLAKTKEKEKMEKSFESTNTI